MIARLRVLWPYFAMIATMYATLYLTFPRWWGPPLALVVAVATFLVCFRIRFGIWFP